MTATATPDLRDVVEQLRELVRGDGADLRLVSVDDTAHVVELALELDDVDCVDCVLPPGRLREVLAAGLAQRGVTTHRLVLLDPRAGGAAAGTAERVVVLDPTGEVDAGHSDPGPDAGRLAGKTVVFRVDVLWQAWDWVVDEWTRAFEAAGVTVRSFRRVQGLAGAEGTDADGEFAAMLAGADVAVVGLGNCGSCTSWTVKDAVLAAKTGTPTAAVVTEQFTGLAAMLSGHYGRPGLRTFVLPFPLQTRPEDDVRTIAREAFPALLSLLGATV